MWTREDLKYRAKAVLRTNYWQAFVVALVMCLLGAEGSGSSSARGNNHEGHTLYLDHPSIVLIGLGIALVLICLRLFVGYMIQVGGTKFFIRAAQGDSNMSYLGDVFHKPYYWDVFKTMIFRELVIFAWTLLLIIPGIVKGYAYCMVPYILADNPNIGYKRALEVSNAMTMGQKFDMWVLDLSFIGWYILGVLALGVGVFFVNPYDYATHAELYLVLREDALKKGLCTYNELNLME